MLNADDGTLKVTYRSSRREFLDISGKSVSPFFAKFLRSN